MSSLENIKILVKEIQNLFFLRKYDLIIKETKKALKKYPNYSIFYNMLGLALTQLGKLNDAKLVLDKGYKINGDDLAIINNLANVHKNMFNHKEAERLYNLSILKKKDYSNAYINYGNLKRDLNKFEEAIKLYEQGLSYNNQIPEINYSIAMAYQSIGNFEKADQYANKTIQIDEKITKADLLISRSKKYKKNDPHLNTMLQKIKKNELNIIQKIDLIFAIAKAYEDLGEVKESFEFLLQGNKLKRSVVNFDINLEKEKFEAVKKIFNNIDLEKFKNSTNNNKKIIFILGMPRSGTTLTEQIISAHSEVYGSGELPYLTKIVNDNLSENKKLSNVKVNEAIGNIDILSSLKDKYYSYLENYEISEKYVTDKAPLNFIWIGLIKILFPNSKIIHCKRNSEDNCVSLYKNVFDGSLNFCYTQNELGKYYNMYSDLMEFWKLNCPDAFLDVEYEKLISDTFNETKKILDFCNLKWEENCLDLSKSKTPIKTASVGQARNQIYSSSVKSSLKYKDNLEELFDLL
tara:strand:- start:548 stop:2107 length:1560 start_codon:yes stop_codon:yes gene_type:complete